MMWKVCSSFWVCWRNFRQHIFTVAAVEIDRTTEWWKGTFDLCLLRLFIWQNLSFFQILGFPPFSSFIRVSRTFLRFLVYPSSFMFLWTRGKLEKHSFILYGICWAVLWRKFNNLIFGEFYEHFYDNLKVYGVFMGIWYNTVFMVRL